MIAIGYQILIALPCISLAIRRMHDANKSGWNILWLYIPTVILLVYAGAILYYTQSPEIVDMFLQFFMAMVVGYVVFLIYSIYLLTHHTYPEKNHYGEVPHTNETKEVIEEDLLEAPADAAVEGTLTFKTKAFIEKARKSKKRSDIAKTEPLQNVETAPLPQEQSKQDEKDTSSKTTEENQKTDISEQNTNIDTVTQKEEATSKDNRKKQEQKSVIKKPKKEIIPETQKEANKEPEKLHDKEEIIVTAQLKPHKKRPIKPKAASPIIKEPIKTDAEQKTKVKTLAEKRSEVQNTTSLSKAALMEEIKKAEEEKKVVAKPSVRKPVKRKTVKPVEVPDMNVETIRTHSLDSIAKLVEQNMNKEPNDPPIVTATMKKKPIKRKKTSE